MKQVKTLHENYTNSFSEIIIQNKLAVFGLKMACSHLHIKRDKTLHKSYNGFSYNGVVIILNDDTQYEKCVFGPSHF